MENRHYETVCIVRADLGEEAVKTAVDKTSDAVAKGGGTVARLDDWGRRKLAFPIRKKHEGHYFVLTYTSEPQVSKEVERILKFNENVLRYQTVVLKELPAAKPAEESTEETAGEAEKAAEGAEEGGANE